VLVLSKADLLSAEEVAARVARWRDRIGPETPVLATSSATGAGLGELAGELLRRVPVQRAVATGAAGVPVGEHGVADDEQLAEHMVFRPAARAGFRVERLGEGSFAVRGEGIERLVARYDVENEDAMAYLEGRLRRIGVIGALEAEGFRAGDELQIAGVTFELEP
jgi:GTP-binding protein